MLLRRTLSPRFHALGRARLVLSLALALLPALSEPALAFFLPPFDLNACAWRATHVAIVSEGEVIDGAVEVLESWHGDLAAGDRISIPGLESFASEEARRVHESGGVPTKRILDARRIVVFLLEGDAGWAPAATGIFGIGISSAWFDGGRAHVRSQLMHSGAQLFHVTISESEMRTHVIAVAGYRDALAAALTITDESERVSRLLPIVRSGVREAVSSAVEAITRIDAALAKSTLRALLRDDSLRSIEMYFVIHALAEIDGVKARPDILALLERELAFWRAREATSRDARLNDRITTSQYAIEALRGADAGCAPIIEDFRAFAQSSKQLRGYKSVFAHCCDAVLKSLAKPVD